MSGLESAPSSSPRDPDEVRREIERVRGEVGEAAVTLQRKLNAVTDWRGWVRKTPLPYLAGAFVLGLFIGRRH